ncbi:MAG: hypothetical protein J7K98_02530, partial [Candidatus Aenigmarchaeota archaeon]|nr:hypothetical protein [Candidatus Aenigmarchaeota archaeon]
MIIQHKLHKWIKTNLSNLDPFEYLERIDWDFKEANTQYLTHTFHSYPARFIPQIPRTFIEIFTQRGDVVLDPFCGCGTTLVESRLLGRNSIGNDLNPLAVLISKVKTTIVPNHELIQLENFVKQLEKEVKLIKSPKIVPKLPNRKLSSRFTQKMIAELQLIREKIDESLFESERIYDIARVALSSTIMSIIERENGNNVYEIFSRKIFLMTKTLRKFSRYADKTMFVKVLEGDARWLEVSNNSVDLIVTSPPYVNALDYYRIHMYSMFWLGINFWKFRNDEIGAHSHHINNRFRLLSEYLGDMLRAMIEMNRVLKKGKICAIVVGNSTVEYEIVESYKHFANMSNKIGFEVKKILHRNIDKNSKYFSMGNIDDEYIVVLRKVKDVDVSS